MSRPREFDRDEALERAVEAFWTKGYGGTSVQNLVDSMGIQRGSLYAAFGDKRQLFLEALEKYEERFYLKMVAFLEAGSSREGIRRVFEQVLEDCACGSGVKGCLITNTAVALAEEDSDVRERVRTNLARVEGAFRESLLDGSRRGQLPARCEPFAVARFLTNSLQGLRVLAKCSVDYDVLKDAVEVTLSILEDPAPPRASEFKKGDAC
ncbi:MAG TPA: TetR/AcrR family transcriptional regulator [Vicinamibacteria bacterium]|nr:TetR/AcrR family transcriptional regulator [Vicinamibacteria bacterium]